MNESIFSAILRVSLANRQISSFFSSKANKPRLVGILVPFTTYHILPRACPDSRPQNSSTSVISPKICWSIPFKTSHFHSYTMPIVMHMVNGPSVDLETKEGANHFIRSCAGGSFEFFTSNLVGVKQICDNIHNRKNQKPTPQEENQLVILYGSAAALAHNADDDVFSMIPSSELQAYMEHVMIEIDRMAQPTSNWSKTGDLKYLYENVLVGGLIDLFMQPMPCKLAYDMDFFKVIAKLSSAPSSVPLDSAETITRFVANALVSTFVFEDQLPTTEQAFKILESCGMLEQFLRLAAISPRSTPGILKFFDELIKCKSLVKKCFTDDKPCGKAVMEILDKPSMRNQALLSRLKMIMSFSSFISKQSNMPSGMKEGYKYCRNCNKMDCSLDFQNSLMRCSRCKGAFYCSRECQVADWKRHKPICQPVTSSEKTARLFTEQTLYDFVRDNYAFILKEIVHVSRETGKGKNELLLELDFHSSSMSNDVAPALKNPPQFKVADSKGYFRGDRPNEPDWFFKKEDKKCYKSNMKSLIKIMEDTYNRLTDDHLMLIVRNPDGHFGCYRFNLQSSETKCQMFSQAMVSAASKAMYDGNFDPLTSLFGKGSNEIKILRREFGGMPDEDELDLIREMLNRNFGANF